MKINFQKLESRGLPWAGILLGLFGASLATFTYLSTRQLTQLSTELQVQQLMYEAVDLLGFEPTGSGMHQLSYATPNLDNSIEYRHRLENARRTIEKLERLAPNFKELDDLWIFYYVQIRDMASAKKLLEQTKSEETSDADMSVFKQMGLIFSQAKRVFCSSF